MRRPSASYGLWITSCSLLWISHASFRSYEDAVLLAELLGADVGDRLHSRFTARSMIQVAADVGREQIKQFFITKDHKPHLC